MKTVISIGMKVIALTSIMFVCFALGSLVLGEQSSGQTPEENGAVLAPLLAVCLLNTLVLTHVVVRSRWGGWRLVAAVFVVFYGIMTVMSQIESAVFVTTLPPGMLPRIFLLGVLIAAPFSVLAVPILGKTRDDAAAGEHNPRLMMPIGDWVWRVAAMVVAYLILYFTFGYFVAWQNPAIREYYGGIDRGSFLAHMSDLLATAFWLVPFQALRGLLWVAIALPVVRMMRGGWLETAVAVGLLFAVLMNAQLLLPNPYMPEAVRMTHLVETASSNFLFGFLVGWLLAQGGPAAVPVRPARDSLEDGK